MSRLETVRVFYDLPAAEVARSALRGQGIPSYLLDAHLAHTAWHYIVALGGVRLAAVREHVELASSLLAAAKDDRIEADALDPCPRCRTDDAFRRSSLIVAALAYLAAGLPLPVEFGRRRCRACGALWRKPD